MKKLFLIISVMVFTLALSSCGGNVNETVKTTDTVETVVDSIKVDTSSVMVKDSLIQCHAITKKGMRCERLCDYPDTLCFQHKKMY